MFTFKKMLKQRKITKFFVTEDNNTYLLKLPSEYDEERRNHWFTKLTGVKAKCVTSESWEFLKKNCSKYLVLIEYVDRSWKIIEVNNEQKG